MHSRASYNRVKDNINIIDAHAPADGKIIRIDHDWNPVANAAGGIMSNLSDLSKWVLMQLSGGKYGNNKMLFNKAVQDELWSPQTIIQRPSGGPYNTHFTAYGLGWQVTDVKGYKQVSHTGGLIGTVTQITLIPELQLGIIVLTNQQSGAAFSAITNAIKDSYLGYPDRDWVKTYGERSAKADSTADKITLDLYAAVAERKKARNTLAPDSLFTGRFRDPWFGELIISRKNNSLWLASVQSPRLSGPLLPYKGNTYIVKWTDRSYDADAFVQFMLDREGKASGFTMQAISPRTDFSFDFQDLDVKRVK